MQRLIIQASIRGRPCRDEFIHPPRRYLSMQAPSYTLSEAFAAFTDHRLTRRQLVSERVVAAIYVFPARAGLLRVRGMVDFSSLMFKAGMVRLMAVFSPARARGRPAARMWFQPLKPFIQTLDVPSCLLRIYRVIGVRSHRSLVVLCFRCSLRWIHDSVCASVSVIGRPACCAGHLGTCFA